MRAALIISDRDNVATALELVAAGRRLTLGRTTVVAIEAIPSGHKIALVDIPAGEPVVKYGSPIGAATAAIAAGAHVHTHNLSSARGRGDLGQPLVAPEAGGRLAEPPDAEDAAVARPAGSGDADE